jgi:hypothetical protein
LETIFVKKESSNCAIFVVFLIFSKSLIPFFPYFVGSFDLGSPFFFW